MAVQVFVETESIQVNARDNDRGCVVITGRISPRIEAIGEEQST
jgi:hypothetical protein